MEISFSLNHQAISIHTDPTRPLLDVLLDVLGLTGTKYGCGEGLCGACTVLIDDDAMPSCQVRIKDVAGLKVTTIEGLEKDGKLHPLQKAFVDHDALQCGFCTPGMILKAYGLLHANPNPTRDRIIEEMEGNLCRCGAHVRIVRAIEAAAKETEGKV